MNITIEELNLKNNKQCDCIGVRLRQLVKDKNISDRKLGLIAMIIVDENKLEMDLA